MKHQIFVIHGGDTFDTYDMYLNFLKNWEIDFGRYLADKRDWKENVAAGLGSDFEVIRPDMPNKRNAQYSEWKIWFEKFIPHFEPEVVLVGHSLGGAFLAKYLSENKFPRTIKAVFLIAAVFDADMEGYPLASFTLPEKLDLQADKIYLYHSKDDPVVPFADLAKFQAKLHGAVARVFTDRGHFNQEELPELVEDIKNCFNESS